MQARLGTPDALAGDVRIGGPGPARVDEPPRPGSPDPGCRAGAGALQCSGNTPVVLSATARSGLAAVMAGLGPAIPVLISCPKERDRSVEVGAGLTLSRRADR